MTRNRLRLILEPVVLLGCAALLLVGALWLQRAPNRIVVPFYIVFGWSGFLWRVAAEINLDWPAIVSGLACVTVLSGAVHWFGRWLASWPGETKIVWRWTKAPVLVGGVAVLFWVGLSAVGLLRSTQSLWQFEGPLFVDRLR